MKDDKFYLIHIMECVTNIENFTVGGRDEFLSDIKTRDAVLRNLQILSESTQRISQELKNAYPNIDWKDLSGLRNVLVHDYLGINYNRVWEFIEKELPSLKYKVETVLNGL